MKKETDMSNKEQQIEALNRAELNRSFANFPAIFSGFMAKGIAEADILPRVNVFTYSAWLAKGRQVRKGEHGVKVTTMIPMDRWVKNPSTGVKVRREEMVPRTATVFHISQTDLCGQWTPRQQKAIIDHAARQAGDDAAAGTAQTLSVVTELKISSNLFE